MEKKYNNFLTVILVLSVIAVIVIVGYYIFKKYQEYDTNKKSEEAFEYFQKQFENNKNKSGDNEIKSNEITNPDGYLIGNENGENENSDDNSGYGESSGGGENKYYYSLSDYYTILGTIQISKINIRIPILQEITTDALNRAACLIYGNLNEVGNAVIIAHNNRNGTYFSNVKKLRDGDIITITDYSGTTIDYVVYNVFQTTPDDASFYTRNTNGLREITLSTCTDNDDSKRIIVFARER